MTKSNFFGPPCHNETLQLPPCDGFSQGVTVHESNIGTHSLVLGYNSRMFFITLNDVSLPNKNLADNIIRLLGYSFALVSIFGTLGLTPSPVRSQPAANVACSPTTLRTEVAYITRITHGPVGAAMLIVEGGTVVAFNGEQRFPMQSVYKLPIGMAVLHQVDVGRLSLSEPVQIKPSDLAPSSLYSPIKERYPNGTKMTVAELLSAMIGDSDGTASDVLLKMAGGPERVTAYLCGLGVGNIVVATSEKAMAQDELVQYRNWATPDAMIRLLRALQQGNSLSASSRRLLLGLMVGSKSGSHRIKGLLPVGTVVAHKTGSSRTIDGLTRATNDVGLVTLPDGRHLAVVVFVSDTRASAAARDAVIAKIARLAWDCRIGQTSHERLGSGRTP